MHRRTFLKALVPVAVGLAACSGTTIDDLLTTDRQRVKEVINLVHTHPYSEGTHYRTRNGITTVDLQSGGIQKRIMISDEALHLDSRGHSKYTFYDEGSDGTLDAARFSDPNVGEVAMTPENAAHFKGEYRRELESIRHFYEQARPKRAPSTSPALQA